MTTRHSTGVVETPPAVDDDLLRDIASEVGLVAGVMPWPYGVERLLASEPMRRYVAAQTADAWSAGFVAADQTLPDVEIPDEMMLVNEADYERMRDENAAKHSQIADLVQAGLDLDVLREELETARQDLDRANVQLRANQAWMTGIQSDLDAIAAGRLQALRERDEARAERDDFTAEVRRLEEVLHSTLDRAEAAEQRVRELDTWESQDLLAEVERLRAASLDREVVERSASTTTDDEVVDEAMMAVLRQRDEAVNAADELADALAGDTWIGEHTSENDPWRNALDSLRARQTGEA